MIQNVKDYMLIDSLARSCLLPFSKICVQDELSFEKCVEQPWKRSNGEKQHVHRTSKVCPCLLFCLILSPFLVSNSASLAVQLFNSCFLFYKNSGANAVPTSCHWVYRLAKNGFWSQTWDGEVTKEWKQQNTTPHQSLFSKPRGLWVWSKFQWKEGDPFSIGFSGLWRERSGWTSASCSPLVIVIGNSAAAAEDKGSSVQRPHGKNNVLVRSCPLCL